MVGPDSGRRLRLWQCPLLMWCTVANLGQTDYILGSCGPLIFVAGLRPNISFWLRYFQTPIFRGFRAAPLAPTLLPVRAAWEFE